MKGDPKDMSGPGAIEAVPQVVSTPEVERCTECEGRMELVRATRPIRVGTREAVVIDEFLRCTECGEETYLPGQMAASQQRASRVIREQEGLLHPEEIRAIRESLGLSQAAFETLIGAGPKTVIRWEKGTVFQQRTTDALLRLLRAVPHNAVVLAKLQGVSLPARVGMEAELKGLLRHALLKAAVRPNLYWQELIGTGGSVRPVSRPQETDWTIQQRIHESVAPWSASLVHPEFN